MNPRRGLLLSLALNVALAGVVAWAAWRRPDGRAPFSVARQLANRTLRVRPLVRESAPVTVEVTAPFHWSEIESTDYRVYRANLRAIGCPEWTVRDILVADVDEVFIERLRQLFAPLHREFWRLFATLDKIEDEAKHYEKDWEALKAERAAVFKALLGREEPLEADEEENRAAEQRAHWAEVLDFLPAEKQDRVASLRESCDAAVRQLWESDHELRKEERAERQQQQRALEAERDRQLAEALTPEELAEYRLRGSPAAEERLRLSRIEFSEGELRTIVRATGERRQTEEGAQQAEAELKAALGEARFADYQRAKDPRFEQISSVAERYGLSEELARSAYEMQLQANAHLAQVRQDKSRSREERAALLQAIHDETERALREVLGAAAFATVEKLGGSGWLGGSVSPGE